VEEDGLKDSVEEWDEIYGVPASNVAKILE